MRFNVCAVRLSLFTLPLGFIGRLCSVIVALPAVFTVKPLTVLLLTAPFFCVFSSSDRSIHECHTVHIRYLAELCPVIVASLGYFHFFLSFFLSFFFFFFFFLH